MTHKKFMAEAVIQSQQSIKKGGGPFGAVIVKDGKIIAANHNRVTINNDPTAHAEVNAIRDASKSLGTWDLSGCIIYSSCEPCPMCLAAIYWAKLSALYYANTKDDAEGIGFSDALIYKELDLSISDRMLPTFKLESDEALAVFKQWDESEDKTSY